MTSSQSEREGDALPSAAPWQPNFAPVIVSAIIARLIRQDSPRERLDKIASAIGTHSGIMSSATIATLTDLTEDEVCDTLRSFNIEPVKISRGLFRIENILEPMGTSPTSAPICAPAPVGTTTLMDDSISSLRLSNRSRNALQRADIYTIGELVEAVEGDGLLAIRHLGIGSMEEIMHSLADSGAIPEPERPPVMGDRKPQPEIRRSTDLPRDVNYLRAVARKYAKENPNARAVHIDDLAFAARIRPVDVYDTLTSVGIPVKPRKLVWFKDLEPVTALNAPAEKPGTRRNISPPAAAQPPWNSRPTATQQDIRAIQDAARSYLAKSPGAESIPVVDLALRTGLEVNSIAPMLRSAGIGSVIINKDRYIRLDQLLQERSTDPRPDRRPELTRGATFHGLESRGNPFTATARWASVTM